MISTEKEIVQVSNRLYFLAKQIEYLNQTIDQWNSILHPSLTNSNSSNFTSSNGSTGSGNSDSTIVPSSGLALAVLDRIKEMEQELLQSRKANNPSNEEKWVDDVLNMKIEESKRILGTLIESTV